MALGLGLTGAFAAPPASAQGLPDFTELVEKVGPAVVGIRTTERTRSARGGGEIDEDMLEFFRRFGLPVPNSPIKPSPSPRTPQQPAPDAEPQ
ncbi:MAG: serine peptidase, partial [Burkholderiales bacterium]